MGLNLTKLGTAVGAGLGTIYGNPAAGAATGGMVGNIFDDSESPEAAANRKNIEAQKEFAQMGVRWRAADARAAGLHPLAAMGAQTHQFSGNIMPETDDRLGNAINAGQNILGMVSSGQTEQERELQTLQIQGAQLDNQNRFMDAQLKQAELDRMRSGPAFPSDESFIDGQANSGGKIKEKPMERTSSMKGAPHSEPGAVTDVGWVKTPTGVVPVPSKDAKERTEDVMPHEFMHFYRNNVLPNFGKGPKPPARKGHYWVWSYADQEYQERKVSDLQNKYRGSSVSNRR